MDDDLVLEISEFGVGHDPKDPLSLVSSLILPAHPRLLRSPTIRVSQELIHDGQWCKLPIVWTLLLFKQYHCSVYYRVFVEGKAVRPKNQAPPHICNDPSIGCVIPNFVAPPHNINSLKRCLCTYEEIGASNDDVELFLFASSPIPIDDEQDFPAITKLGAGAVNPLVLVIRSGQHSDRELLAEPADGPKCKQLSICECLLLK